MHQTNSMRRAQTLLLFDPTFLMSLEKEEDWRRHIRQQIDDELNRRVRDALETPPLERLRRRQLQNQAKA